MKAFRKLSLVTTVATWLLITIGGLVRGSGSGLGCPDWPKCHGNWVPPFESKALIEYSHRLTASIVGALILAMAIFAWLRLRTSRPIFWGSFTALVAVIVQAGIGRQVVLGELPRGLVALHFFVSTVVLGSLVLVTASAYVPARRTRQDMVTVHTVVTVGAVWAVLMLGAFVSQFHAALAFGDWPLMDGSIVPPGSGPKLLHYVHRLAALLLGINLIHLFVRIKRVRPGDRILKRVSLALIGLWAVQVIGGGLNVLTRLSVFSIVLHVSLGALLWAGSVAITVAAMRRPGGEPSGYVGVEQTVLETSSPAAVRADDVEDAVVPARAVVARGVRERVRAYVMLTKPRIIELLLITTVPAMVVAAKGMPSWGLVLATLIGGSLTAGSANSINCLYDRDIDEAMARTHARPLPAKTVDPRNALVFGVVLGVAGFLWLWLTANLLAAALAVSAILFYVFVYTAWLKRRTPSNIVIGGAAGAVPVLVGWAAVSGRLDAGAWVMFAIIFFWTPPHFWALAIRYADEYSAARVPMLPVVSGAAQTARQMLLYSLVLLPVSILLVPLAGLGALYLVTALILGAGFIGYCFWLVSEPSKMRAMKVFHFSLAYLVLVMVGAGLDSAIGLPALPGPYLAVCSVAFFLVEIPILLSAFGYRRVSGRFRVSPAAEFAWTALPVIAIAALLISVW
ncbi:MAG TPA: heme o synthase [Actinomycetota bacterium]|nr:heme o synthase [Actinomycetota bacterium]